MFEKNIRSNPVQVATSRDFSEEPKIWYLNKDGIWCYGHPWEDREG